MEHSTLSTNGIHARMEVTNYHSNRSVSMNNFTLLDSDIAKNVRFLHKPKALKF